MGYIYIFWLANLHFSTLTFIGLISHLCDGGDLPVGFNFSSMIFPPKKVEVEESLITRSASTRPISLKNADNKILASAINAPIAARVGEVAHASQTGFIRGRNFLSNVVLADSYSRAASLERLPVPACTVAYDIKVAFPSLSHSFLFAVLRSSGAPAGYQQILLCLYTDCQVFIFGSSFSGPVFTVHSGVLQGCPMSATLFVIAIQPHLSLTNSKLLRGELVCACADDVLTVLRTAASLIWVYYCFRFLARVSGLVIEPTKLHFIPLSSRPTLQLIETFRNHLLVHTPDWAGAKIGYCIKYLGFFLGPRSAASKWRSQIEKYNQRCLALSLSQRSASIVLPIYCSHVISVLSYIGQLEPLEKDAMQSLKEQYWLQKLLRVIPGTFSHAALTKLPLVGLPRVPSVFVSLLASRYRTKLRTIPAAFVEGKQVLDNAFQLNIPLSQICTDNLATPFWDTPSFVASSDSAVAACSRIFPLISTIPSLDRGFQRSVHRNLETRSFADFDWLSFVKRRLQLTFHSLRGFSSICSISSYLSPSALPFSFLFPSSSSRSVVDPTRHTRSKKVVDPTRHTIFQDLEKQLRRLRPVLVSCWLRWSLNSLPTAGRLHDNGFSVCPFCCSSACDASHLIACERPFRLAHRLLGTFDPCKDLSHPYKQVQSQNNFCSLLVPKPFPFSLHILIRLGALSPDLEMTSLALYLVQYSFTSLRRSCHCVPKDDDTRILNSMHAALQSIGVQPLLFPLSLISPALPLEEAGVDAPAAAALCLPLSLVHV